MEPKLHVAQCWNPALKFIRPIGFEGPTMPLSCLVGRTRTHSGLPAVTRATCLKVRFPFSHHEPWPPSLQAFKEGTDKT
ncbi:hypothetical protein GBA52_012015 [Prunus armeniaca]|nr:hypothetical protein GBA52_012015 [Prunus armeniaca]